MRDADQAERLIEAVVNATLLPVTLKMRLGWDAQNLNAPEIARRAARAGVRMLTIHGRTRQQFYKGRADWAAIRTVVDAVKIPVIANGDIASANDAREAMQISGACGVMIGRAAQGKPWLVGAIQHALRTSQTETPPPFDLQLDSLLKLYDATLEFYGAKLGVRIARKHIAWSLHAAFENGPHAQNARRQICTLEDPRAVRGHLRSLFGTSELGWAA
jgi:nifR3 family TIM-barrel protein